MLALYCPINGQTVNLSFYIVSYFVCVIVHSSSQIYDTVGGPCLDIDTRNDCLTDNMLIHLLNNWWTGWVSSQFYINKIFVMAFSDMTHVQNSTCDWLTDKK